MTFPDLMQGEEQFPVPLYQRTYSWAEAWVHVLDTFLRAWSMPLTWTKAFRLVPSVGSITDSFVNAGNRAELITAPMAHSVQLADTMVEYHETRLNGRCRRTPPELAVTDRVKKIWSNVVVANDSISPTPPDAGHPTSSSERCALKIGPLDE